MGPVRFEAEGFCVVDARSGRAGALHAYRSINHVLPTSRALLVGTSDGVLDLRNGEFDDPVRGPLAARDALIERIAATPGGQAQLHTMAALEALSARKRRPWAIWTTCLLCFVGTACQLADPLVDQIGAFVPELFRRGELWRGVTAHFLHALPALSGLVERVVPGLRGLPIHLAINVAGLFVLGPLVEKPLGRFGTALVILLGALGTVIGILAAAHHEVIGASGLVAALVGATLALELHHPERLPADCRLPRRLFLFAVFVQFGLIDPMLRSFIAGGAHLGGFAGGYAAAFWLGIARPDAPRVEPRLRLAALAGMVAAGALGFGVVPLARHEPAALERHAERLANVPADPFLYLHDNAAAWFIATEGKASARALELAVVLAERAVDSTGRLHPGVLDTLAEAQFQSGDRVGAIMTIEEAIALAPFDAYFAEQRLRFTGERAPEDRPPPPGEEGRDGEGGTRRWPWPFGDDDDSAPYDPDAPRITT